MRTKDLIDLAGNPSFISGIYNYCDRWCERCSFTSRCLLYATVNEDADDPAARDITNAEFWHKLGKIFRETQEMISALAAEQGIDLSSIPEEFLRDKRDHVDVARKDELSVEAENYAFTINKWFDEQLLQSEESDVQSPSETEEAEATAVIRWYQFQIPTKIVRGLISRNDGFEQKLDDFSRDSNGSIKVALIGIERSISAWRLMQMARPDLFNSIAPFLLMLEVLRCDIERAFPRARDFIRPGFDEIAGMN